MRLLRSFCLVALCVPLLAGCVFMNVKTTLDINLDRTQLGTKVGTADAYMIAWLVAWGDSGTQAAAQQGGLTEINHADQELLVVLFGLYARQRTVLYGN